MKKYILIFILILKLVSCQIDEHNKPTNTDYFIFGTGYGECIGNCSHYYSINNGKIYSDDMLAAYELMKFSNTPLSNEKYLLAKPLLDSFPQYLKNNPNITIGCPDCVDQGRIYIEFSQNGQIVHWNIDTIKSNHPKEIKDYLEKLITILDHLK